MAEIMLYASAESIQLSYLKNINLLVHFMSKALSFNESPLEDETHQTKNSY